MEHGSGVGRLEVPYLLLLVLLNGLQASQVHVRLFGGTLLAQTLRSLYSTAQIV